MSITLTKRLVKGSTLTYEEVDDNWNQIEEAINSLIDQQVEVAATKAAVNPGIKRRHVIVTADETNNGDTSLYIHNGTTLKFLQTIS
jgi:hypothetical protein